MPVHVVTAPNPEAILKFHDFVQSLGVDDMFSSNNVHMLNTDPMRIRRFAIVGAIREIEEARALSTSAIRKCHFDRRRQSGQICYIRWRRRLGLLAIAI